MLGARRCGAGRVGEAYGGDQAQGLGQGGASWGGDRWYRGAHGTCDGPGRRVGQFSRSSTTSQLLSMAAVLDSMAMAEQYLS